METNEFIPGTWEMNYAGDLFRGFTLGQTEITLRVVLGGNGKFTPMIEVYKPRPLTPTGRKPKQRLECVWAESSGQRKEQGDARAACEASYLEWKSKQPNYEA